jgi:glycosyltransferase involved in cell wall biosynthesis
VVVVRDSGELARLVSEADTVHAHVSAFSPLGLRAAEVAARSGVPVVVTVHSMWGAGWPVVRAVGLMRSWPDLPIQWAAVSEAAAGPVRRALAGRPVMVLPNAIDTALWAPAGTLPDRCAVRQGRSEVTIVGVQRMARRKRPLPLLTTLQNVRALVPDKIRIRAVLIGDGPQLGTLRRRIDAAGMTAWVDAPGVLSHSQLRELYRASDIFVAPATLESFGIAALEARSSGLAVVGRTSTGVADFVTHGVEGLLAEDDLEMAGQLACLCTDRGLLGSIQTYNRAIRPAFDWQDTLWRTDYAYAASAELRTTAGKSVVGFGSVGVAP